MQTPRRSGLQRSDLYDQQRLNAARSTTLSPSSNTLRRADPPLRSQCESTGKHILVNAFGGELGTERIAPLPSLQRHPGSPRRSLRLHIAAAGSASVTVQNPGGAVSNAHDLYDQQRLNAHVDHAFAQQRCGGRTCLYAHSERGSNFVNGSVVSWNGSESHHYLRERHPAHRGDPCG